MTCRKTWKTHQLGLLIDLLRSVHHFITRMSKWEDLVTAKRKNSNAWEKGFDIVVVCNVEHWNTVFCLACYTSLFMFYSSLKTVHTKNITPMHYLIQQYSMDSNTLQTTDLSLLLIVVVHGTPVGSITSSILSLNYCTPSRHQLYSLLLSYINLANMRKEMDC